MSSSRIAADSGEVREVFDERYFERFYRDGETRAVSSEEADARADFVLSFVRFVEVPLTRLLDLGAGLGVFEEPLTKRYPKASYHGVDVSEYTCERFGWTLASIDEFEGDGTYELVVCHDVIQYLDDRRAAKAIDNIARLCSDVLYFGALTTQDWADTADRARTDDEVYLRSGRWYRNRLARHFIEIGGGLFVRHDAPISLWELESR